MNNKTFLCGCTNGSVKMTFYFRLQLWELTEVNINLLSKTTAKF